ncbi:MAG: 30S ribosomal protein S18 [Candidatus Kerfeldbacteria bacterium]|nr:30S ribosomal protein S18 [Candidatus Kerfeldbacteria bacterium]
MHTPQTPKVVTQKDCYFCINGLTDVEYRDTDVMKKFLSSYAKILPRKKTGICAKHQRKLSQAVKRARFMALVQFTTR